MSSFERGSCQSPLLLFIGLEFGILEEENFSSRGIQKNFLAGEYSCVKTSCVFE